MPGTFRADHVGSLLRPVEVKEARSAFQGGRLGTAELREIEDRAIGDALERQRAAGVHVLPTVSFGGPGSRMT